MQEQQALQEQHSRVEWPRLQKHSQHPLLKHLEALQEPHQWLLKQVHQPEDPQLHLVPAEGVVGLL